MPIIENEISRKITFLAIVFVVALVLQSIAGRIIRRIIYRSNIPKGSIFANLSRALVWLIALLIVLEPVFGVQPTSFMTALGVTSIAISFGLQTTIANMISGLGLMLAHVIEVGDWIEIAGYQGAVTDITWRSTIIKTLIGDVIVIPNSVLNTTTLRKMAPASSRSVTISIDIHPEADMAEVERDVRESVEKACAQWIDPELGVVLIGQGYGSFGFRLDVRVGLRSIQDGLAVRSAIMDACSGRPWLARW